MSSFDPKTLEALRRDYTRAGLDEHDASPDPFVQFELWLGQAIAAPVAEPNAMTVATADAAGVPSARTVLLKGFDRAGLVFYTSYASAKARDIEANPAVALLFFWPELERQIRVQGTAAKVPLAESAAYFATRPRGSQLGAWASAQSAPIADRAELEARVREIERTYENRDIPLPPTWGGYRVAASRFEFWQGRPSRLHDRIVYVPSGEAWRRGRVAP